ncbi:phosphoesterase PA-phosphatase related protein [Nitrosococcus halophilus Nc 4]|uniref:undecaprenyl-diphosphate phosphatase n=1 Tax=Nitrosococcus halophilus (strain Nc4) TaxID=472759 RepID=D5BZP6_NITHN|nr:phosphatase PAP2 family protein [Nitrosococcus halophilus]ADE14341.1 phosphoesterase PA-phosphatase related protein [Nitrosococcus halophilus Nc 4]
MSTIKASNIFQRMDQYELTYCLRFNRICRLPQIKRLFAAISRLGDGVFWYTLMLVLPMMRGEQGLIASLHMLVVGLIALLIYKWLKGHMERPRPFTTHEGIHIYTAPLDHYSFPSGHTLHAIGFTIIAVGYFPELAWLLVPFTALVALSRIVLGLHYPTDVLAGAAIGTAIAMVSWNI